jgi:hypothetical protein
MEVRRLTAFELGRIFGHTRKEATGEWRKLHNEVLHMYSPNIIRVIKSRKMRRARNVACIGKERNA